MTDPSVHRLCVADGIDLHLAPGHATADEVRRLRDVRTLTVAPVVDPAFRPARGRHETVAARRRLGLPINEQLAVVVAGSWGVGDIDRTVRDIAASATSVPVVACGRNESLRRRLTRSGAAIALGWVDAMPDLLRAADVVVHNAGGLSSMEALASGVPLISYRCLPGHGVANAAVLAAEGLSAWPTTPAEFAAALRCGLNSRRRRPPAAPTVEPDAAKVVAQMAGYRTSLANELVAAA
jgi:UDP-N-acetylglucosamine:LPS N-acetylglucosamine transferase